MRSTTQLLLWLVEQALAGGFGTDGVPGTPPPSTTAEEEESAAAVGGCADGGGGGSRVHEDAEDAEGPGWVVRVGRLAFRGRNQVVYTLPPPPPPRPGTPDAI
eukprot:COSAG01_NODE_35003_length_538_cov_2.697039_1_plen_102_part_10